MSNIDKKSMLKKSIPYILLIVASVFLIFNYRSYKEDLDKINKEKEKLQRLIDLSEFYSLQAHKVWGNKANKCSTSLIQCIDSLVISYGKGVVTTETVLAIMTIESGFNEHVKSPTNAYGLMQIVLSTANANEKGTTIEQLYKPIINIRIGIKEFANLIIRFNGNKELALLGYNRGPAGAMIFTSNAISKDDYVRKVIASNYNMVRAMKDM